MIIIFVIKNNFNLPTNFKYWSKFLYKFNITYCRYEITYILLLLLLLLLSGILLLLLLSGILLILLLLLK